MMSVSSPVVLPPIAPEHELLIDETSWCSVLDDETSSIDLTDGSYNIIITVLLVQSKHCMMLDGQSDDDCADITRLWRKVSSDVRDSTSTSDVISHVGRRMKSVLIVGQPSARGRCHTTQRSTTP